MGSLAAVEHPDNRSGGRALDAGVANVSAVWDQIPHGPTERPVTVVGRRGTMAAFDRPGWVPIGRVINRGRSAFSPTDTMPLTSRVKILMGVQATAALVTSLLVIARAVGALGGG